MMFEQSTHTLREQKTFKNTGDRLRGEEKKSFFLVAPLPEKKNTEEKKMPTVR